MQYSQKVTIEHVGEFDDYGQPLGSTSDTLRCCIVDEYVSNTMSATKRKNQYDLSFFISAKAFGPYSELFEDNMIRVTRNGRSYDNACIKQINDYSGRAKYYQVSLKQVRK